MGFLERFRPTPKDIEPAKPAPIVHEPQDASAHVNGQLTSGSGTLKRIQDRDLEGEPLFETINVTGRSGDLLVNAQGVAVANVDGLDVRPYEAVQVQAQGGIWSGGASATYGERPKPKPVEVVTPKKKGLLRR